MSVTFPVRQHAKKMKIKGLENRCPTDLVLVNETPQHLLCATQDGLVYVELRNLKAIKIHLKGNLLPFKLAYVSSKNCLCMSNIDQNAVWKVIIKERTVHKIYQVQFHFIRPHTVCYHPNLSVIAVCHTSSIIMLKDNCTLLSLVNPIQAGLFWNHIGWGGAHCAPPLCFSSICYPITTKLGMLVLWHKISQKQ